MPYGPISQRFKFYINFFLPYGPFIEGRLQRRAFMAIKVLFPHGPFGQSCTAPQGIYGYKNDNLANRVIWHQLAWQNQQYWCYVIVLAVIHLSLSINIWKNNCGLSKVIDTNHWSIYTIVTISEVCQVENWPYEFLL